LFNGASPTNLSLAGISETINKFILPFSGNFPLILNINPLLGLKSSRPFPGAFFVFS